MDQNPQDHFPLFGYLPRKGNGRGKEKEKASIRSAQPKTILRMNARLCHRGIDGRSRTQMYASPAIEETRVRENTSALSAENRLTHGPLNKISCASVHL